jgi:ubiquinone/menaquinone biosynthesis C-methylase UbiE
MENSDAKFVGSIPEKYNTDLGPMLFEPYAADFVRRMTFPPACQVLELACGTGILTRRILESLPGDGRLMATDLNQPMLDEARKHLKPDPRLEWKAVDAMKLPYPDASFHRIACQFGVMFFPDKRVALKDAFRILKPQGRIAFSVWDSLKENSISEVVERAVSRFFPDNPPAFFHIPFGFHDRDLIRSLMREAGFGEVALEEVPLQGVGRSALLTAEGLVQGTPLMAAIQERGVTDPRPIVEAVAKVVASDYGDSPTRFRMQALWVEGTKK